MNSNREEEILERLPKWMQELFKIQEEIKKEKLNSKMDDNKK